jgi:hypothetical protein
MTIEKAMQLIKGGFSYRLKKEFGYAGEVWQRGFSELRVNDRQSFFQHREYLTKCCGSRTGEFSGSISLLLFLFGKAKGGGG